MNQKIFSSVRIAHKHDTEENWLKAVDFVPLLGEFIVYSPDSTYFYSRFKIGDGVSTVNELSFIGDVGGSGILDAGPIVPATDITGTIDAGAIA